MAVTISGFGSFTGVDLSASNFGKILQVAQATKTNAVNVTTTDSWLDIDGLSVDITPTASTSKIYVVGNIGYLDGSNAMAVGFRFTRNGTVIGVGNLLGNRIQVTFGRTVDTADRGETVNGSFLDSPATTSALTYKLQVYKADTGTAYINRFNSDNDNNNRWRSLSSITVMEVAA